MMRDDANDTLLFKELEKNALKASPNPQRIGCPDSEVLRRFVDTPNKVTVDELHGWHIYECRECTAQLKELRRFREEGLRNAMDRSKLDRLFGWRPLIAVVLGCFFVMTALFVWRNSPERTIPVVQDADAVRETINLSSEGTPRGNGSDATISASSLPRRIVKLDLILPYFSPPGEYRVAVTKNGSLESTEVEQRSTATARRSLTELRVTIDLRRLPPGRYNLVTLRTADGAQASYPLNIY